MMMLMMLICASRALETLKKMTIVPPIEESSRRSTVCTLEFHIIPASAAADAAAAHLRIESTRDLNKTTTIVPPP